MSVELTVKQADLALLAQSSAKATKEFIGREIKELVERIKALEELVTDLPPGPKGETGERGERGEIGERGEKGLSGDAGTSGEKGQPGEAGPIGLQGIPGLVGERGPQGERGERGEKGDIGLQGVQGPQGVAGRDGLDGKDALDIRILDFIDPEKRVPRGTFAIDKGGISRFNGDVWQMICRGIDLEAEELSEDGRTLTRVTYYSDGSVFKRTFDIAAMLYREIFKDGTEYQRGDVVTYGGSAWHCQAVVTKLRPETDSKDWRLMVKKGAQGINGKDGAMGPEGPAGKDGRDLTRIGS